VLLREGKLVTGCGSVLQKTLLLLLIISNFVGALHCAFYPALINALYKRRPFRALIQCLINARCKSPTKNEIIRKITQWKSENLVVAIDNKKISTFTFFSTQMAQI
jgi:hypothetical protein